MKNAFFFVLMLVAVVTVNAQSKKSYVEGNLQGANQNLKGYFWFDNALVDGAQRIYYKETLESDKKELNASEFERFESADVYREKFNVASASATRGAEVLLPRIEKGKINLYKYDYVVANQKHNLNRENHYYIQKGLVKTRVSFNNFKDKMQELVGDNKELMAKIKNNDLGYYKLQEIVATYNNGSSIGTGSNDVSSGGN